MTCDGRVLEVAGTDGRAKQRLEGYYTGTCEQTKYAEKILLEGITVTIMLLKYRVLYVSRVC
jgi:hypothetical protein